MNIWYIVRTTLLAISSIWGCHIYGQQATTGGPEESTTKLGSFQAKTGSVIIKEFSEIGGVKAIGHISVMSMTFTDASTNKRESGISIHITEGGRLEKESRSFIDFDEIDSLVAGIDYISKVKKDSSKLDFFEATYRTKDDFHVTIFNRKSGEISVSVESGRIRPATVFLSLEQLANLRTLMLQAKERIDAKK